MDKIKNCPTTKILNPITKRCVLKTAPLGKSIELYSKLYDLKTLKDIKQLQKLKEIKKESKKEQKKEKKSEDCKDYQIFNPITIYLFNI